MFSSRLPATLASNSLARAVDRLERDGIELLDLTATNPTDAGIAYVPEMLGALADPRGVRYQPAALGLASAREAIAADYVRLRTPVAPDRIVLTSSTSEAYGFLFKLLCDPGDAVLVPQPSYPLFEWLTALEGVAPRPYSLEYHGAWSIDRDSVERALTPRTRAVLIVSPNNPTGSMLRRDDREWIVDLAARHDLAVIADEVFAHYPLSPRADACSMAGDDRVPVFVLGGLSKSVGLPQIKLAWIATGGPSAMVRTALERLELICDTYLTVATPTQIAAAALLESGASVRAAIAARVRRNLDSLRERLASHPAISLLEPEGGWAAVLQIPATKSEEALVLDVLERARVLVHPGYFFDFAREAFIVVSLLPPPPVFDEAVARVLPIAAGAAA